MRLEDWINKNKLSQEEAGKLIGVKQASISRWINGIMTPSLDKIKKISLVTNNEVTFHDFY
ncbi:helix-turn-helix domain-containing protein, partial [Commensalibacter intestini]|uniref:helix-turn-helix domain-containing protein n=1 Tax=Commensalibacter intestini TaxID=479936 RepID=UPI00058BB466